MHVAKQAIAASLWYHVTFPSPSAALIKRLASMLSRFVASVQQQQPVNDEASLAKGSAANPAELPGLASRDSPCRAASMLPSRQAVLAWWMCRPRYLLFFSGGRAIHLSILAEDALLVAISVNSLACGCKHLKASCKLKACWKGSKPNWAPCWRVPRWPPTRSKSSATQFQSPPRSKGVPMGMAGRRLCWKKGAASRQEHTLTPW